LIADGTEVKKFSGGKGRDMNDFSFANLNLRCGLCTDFSVCGRWDGEFLIGKASCFERTLTIAVSHFQSALAGPRGILLRISEVKAGGNDKEGD
jgi:hypothetical protein